MQKNKILTIGSGAMNLLITLKEKNLKNFEFISILSDEQLVEHCIANKKLIISDNGLGAGGNSAKGKIWAEMAKDKIKDLIMDCENLVIYSNFGGGTGSGATPVVVKIAKEMNIPTQVIVTIPFSFEGKKRKEKAFSALSQIQLEESNVIVISNDIILSHLTENISMREAFKIVDEIVYRNINNLIF